MTERLVVVGGGAAGMSAASAARRIDPALEITVLEAGGHAAYGLCGLPYFIGGVVDRPDRLVSYPPEVFRRQRRIDLRLGARVARVDVPAARVEVAGPDGAYSLGYDRLVVAAGGAAVVPRIPGADHPRVFTVRELGRAIELRGLLDAGRVGHAVVVGAGYVGLETAEAFAEHGVAVTVVDVLPRVTAGLDEPMADLVEAELRMHAEVLLGREVRALVPGPRGLRVELDPGSPATLSADVVVLAVGVRPATGPLAAAGAALGPAGALLVDDHMRTSLDGVLAAGDCVALHHVVLDAPAYVPLGPAANKTGRVAGTVAAGGEARFGGIAGTAVVKVFGLTAARTGLGLDEAHAAGLDAVATDVTARSRAKYYPGGAPMAVRLVHERDGRLLGAQLVGADGVATRIDVVAAALHAHLGVEDLAGFDLAYAPPYSPVYDPLLQAAQAALWERSAPRAPASYGATPVAVDAG